MAGFLRLQEGMNTSNELARLFVVAAALLGGCATSPRSRPEQPQRVSDSAPDKIAAQRSAAGLHLEEEDDRWGFTAARELKQRQEPKEPKKEPQQQPPASAHP